MIHTLAQHENAAHGATVTWFGRSGRTYVLDDVPVDSFTLEGSNLYLLLAGSELLWLGTACDIVSDTTSRACFRTALKMASSARSFAMPGDELSAMQARFDIEGGSSLPPLALAS